MSETMKFIISTILHNLFEAVYIGALVFAFCHSLSKYFTDITNELTRKQNIHQKAIVKLKNIINIDANLINEQTEQLEKIMEDITSIKGILHLNKLNSNKSDYKSDNEKILDDSSDESNSEYSDEQSSSQKNKPIFPLQNHITFPHFFILNDKNFKQTKLQNNTHELRFIGDDLRLISYQLAKFLKVKSGTCMEINEAASLLLGYLLDNRITNIAEDYKLCELFGINENQDYSYPDFNKTSIKILIEILEPHFKKII